MNGKLEKQALIVLYLILFLNVVFMFAERSAVDRNYQNGLINQTYNRATNCFAATTPTQRTAEYVKHCYDSAEAATGKQIDRYGDANE